MTKPDSMHAPPPIPVDAAVQDPRPQPKQRVRARVLQGVAVIGLLFGGACCLTTLVSIIKNGAPWYVGVLGLMFWVVPLGLLVEIMRLQRAAAGCFSMFCLLNLLLTPLFVRMDTPMLSPIQRTELTIILSVMWSVVPLLTLICWRDLGSTRWTFSARRKGETPPR